MALASRSPANVAQALGGIDFPADKKKMLEYARSHGADPQVLQLIEQMPEEQYTSMADVFKGVGMTKEK